MLGTVRVTRACDALGAPSITCNEFGPEYERIGTTKCTSRSAFENFWLDALRCEKKKYLGPIDNCCIGIKPSTASKLTCNPAHVPGASICNSAMSKFCTPTKILSDPKCLQWVQRQKEASTGAVRAFCATKAGLDDPRCRDFCATDSGCDSAVIDWCGDPAHATHPYCGCINSSVADASLGVNPKCVDGKCLSGAGYLTNAMRATACPSIISCSMQIALKNSGTSFSTNIPLEQNCGNNSKLAAATDAPMNPTTGSINTGLKTTTQSPAASAGNTSIKPPAASTTTNPTSSTTSNAPVGGAQTNPTVANPDAVVLQDPSTTNAIVFVIMVVVAVFVMVKIFRARSATAARQQKNFSTSERISPQNLAQ